jgi:hypothetical protein
MTEQQPISRFAAVGMNPKRLAGLRSRRLQNLKGRFGAANRGRRLDPNECRAVEQRLREQGKIQ